jgi:EAL domain-containing protein (putative c-di-GMP-specific phosphodiesterase class I)
MPDRIAALLARHHLPGDALVVEITEDALVADQSRAHAILERVRRLGVRVSIDDYGTGYSSLSYLRTLPVDELKLDRTFTANLADTPADAAIVRTTVDLAHSLGLRLVAEGIEDAESVRLLAGLGCDVGQGYHIARPMPADRILDWILDHCRGRAVAGTPAG